MKSGILSYVAVPRTCYKCTREFTSGATKRICPDCRLPKKRSERNLTGELSVRQRQVMALVATGKSNKQIAWDLKLTEGTIKEYLIAIYRKTGTANRTELTRRVFMREIAELKATIAELTERASAATV